MRTPDITLKAGDRLPVISRTIKVDGTAVDLTGYTVAFRVQALTGGSLLVDQTATIDADPTTGVVTYALTAADAVALGTAGTYAAWFEATISSTTLTAPNDGFLVLEVLDSGADAGWSYTGDPANRTIDEVRFLINDTNPDDPKIRDAEIEYLLSARGSNTLYAAADAADQLSAQYAATAGLTKKVGDLELSRQAGAQSTEYAKLAMRLRNRAAVLSGGVLSAGGSSGTDPIFSVGMMDSDPAGSASS